jgi:uncharacterized membrane protein YbhN (UPF0104 family)
MDNLIFFLRLVGKSILAYVLFGLFVIWVGYALYEVPVWQTVLTVFVLVPFLNWLGGYGYSNKTRN